MHVVMTSFSVSRSKSCPNPCTIANCAQMHVLRPSLRILFVEPNIFSVLAVMGLFSQKLPTAVYTINYVVYHTIFIFINGVIDWRSTSLIKLVESGMKTFLKCTTFFYERTTFLCISIMCNFNPRNGVFFIKEQWENHYSYYQRPNYVYDKCTSPLGFILGSFTLEITH